MLLACELRPSTLFEMTIPLNEERSKQESLPGKKSRLATGLKAIISDSNEMAQIKELISQYATFDLPVLITGESGTGKELVAKAIHECGPRRKEPFLAINCAADPR